jgi:hypothetical protein
MPLSLLVDATPFPTHIMAKGHRVVGRLVTRLAVEPPTALGESDLAGALRQLDLVIDWCVILKKARPAFPVETTSPA